MKHKKGGINKCGKTFGVMVSPGLGDTFIHSHRIGELLQRRYNSD